MSDFFHRFFSYYIPEGGGSASPYSDTLGGGAFSDWRHYFWMILVVLISVTLWHLFRRYKKAGRIFCYVILGMLFIIRLSNQTFRAAIGAEIPAVMAFPFHMCTVMTFLLPITFYLKLRPIKEAVYALSLMGGVVTVINGDYFESAFLPFQYIEGIWAHTVLVVIPIIFAAVGEWKIEIKNCWKPFAGLLVLCGWATLANDVFFKAYNTNYMYLKENGLPGNFGGKYYILVYAVIFVLLLIFIYLPPELYRKRRYKADVPLVMNKI
jgi:uncharacterized membrane protein YwaF